MKKILSIVGTSLLVLTILLVVFLGSVIKGAIEAVGPKVLGVPIQVEKVRVNLLTGGVRVKALSIGNPEGFHTPSMVELDDLKMVISLPSLFVDTIVIKKILIEGAEVTFEKSLTSNNIETLQEQLAKKEDDGTGKKVIVEDFRSKGAKLNVSVTGLKGKQKSLPLPPIHLTDIGKESDGFSPLEFTKEMVGVVSKTVLTVVTSSVDFAGNTLKVISTGAGNTLKAISNGAGSVLKGIGNLLDGD
ncbi:MAG: AsmA family protein [Pontiellaceae bacterium]|nr:AsmA family protein [Pontiellaceae bacterium]